MTEPSVRCACCGEERAAADVARLHCRPEIAICGGCVRYLGGQVDDRPVIRPILPVHDMAAVTEFWERAGLDVELHGPGYAFIALGGSEIAHLDLQPGLDPATNPAACYVHVPDPDAWQARWKALGLPVSEVEVAPWGMREFSVRDPSGNLVRIGRGGGSAPEDCTAAPSA